MSDFEHSTGVTSDDALEQLLKRATPRPMPSSSDEATVRQAVRAEWQNVSNRHKSRRRMMSFAIAATVLISVFAVLSVFRLSGVDAVQVASIEKSFGSIYLLGESSELRETRDLANVLSGQTIVTGSQAGIGLAWLNGGSMRMDENTRVEFVNDATVYLKSGRIYFDSSPPALIAGITTGGMAEFVVHTDLGKVAHIGTQFMTGVDAGTLTVSVREGQVGVEGQYHSQIASSGEQLTLSGRQRPAVLSISRSGESWEWVSRTSPPANVDGKTLHEFLLWACRELGLEIQWEGQAEQVARGAILRGRIDTEPAEALRQRMATAALAWHIDQGVIYIGENQ
ncbi:MAG: FecR family protein [Gammaproteobacteria bacterium]|nr:FecR family protein [Gammaproteobacteria bacterium]MBT8111838.1 FecR family protein [Gammaproteobacteria bacterium]NND48514.1 FecR domain-containing protein [Woeseiaceae bacterium]NNL46537.1 FecR domain-containing protein [Woeseiaceae bacterium]